MTTIKCTIWSENNNTVANEMGVSIAKQVFNAEMEWRKIFYGIRLHLKTSYYSVEQYRTIYRAAKKLEVGAVHQSQKNMLKDMLQYIIEEGTRAKNSTEYCLVCGYECGRTNTCLNDNMCKERYEAKYGKGGYEEVKKSVCK